MGAVNDTIIAISSAPVPALRGIIRISGPDAFKVIAPYYEGQLSDLSGRIQGKLAIADWNTAIEVVIYLMKAPHSYTGENVAEIHAFSSPVLFHKLMNQFMAQGARPALPGEFTRRAFLAGRMDLAQAESVQALIAASSEAERRRAMRGMSGELSRDLKKISDDLTEALAILETSIDFVEEDIGPISQDEVVQRLQRCLKALKNLSHTDHRADNLITVCICGLPNAGKSSLFNCLLQRKAAITSEFPGTTLDWIEGEVMILRSLFKLIDTPGITEEPRGIQARAQEKAREILKGADLILYLIESETPFSELNLTLFQQLPDVPVLFLKSKADLPSCWSSDLIKANVAHAEVMEVSIYDDKTITALRQWLKEKGSEAGEAQEPLLLSVRQQHVAREVAGWISSALEGFSGNISCEFLAVDLRSALNLIGELTGRVTTEDILDRIFSQFCIGK